MLYEVITSDVMSSAQPTTDDPAPVPGAVSDAERRRRQRFPVDGPKPLTATSRGRIYTCELQDISLDGIRLSFQDEMPEGNVIALDHPVITSYSIHYTKLYEASRKPVGVRTTPLS